MQYHEFVGQVQHRARLGTQGEAVRAIHATLETLGERLFGGEAHNLAAQLPQEIGDYLERPIESESFDLDEFYDRVAMREGVDLPDALYHARAVIEVLREATSPDLMNKVMAQFPEEYTVLFDAGSRRKMS
jgi:uncharacterized protein (DUF2267 family)